MKPLYIILIIIIVLAVIVLGFSIFNTINGNVIKNNEKPVKIGVIIPLTGSQSAYGQGIKEGLELALKEINSGNNKKIELVYEDNAGDIKNSVSAAQKFIEVDKVPIIITGVSQNSVAVAPIAEKEKTVQFTIASQTGALKQAGDYIFMSDGTLSSIGEKVAELMYKKGYRKAGAISAQYNDATVDARDAFVKKFEELGGKVVSSESFAKDETDFKTYLSKIKSSEPEVIFINGLQQDNGRIIKQIEELGMEQKLYGSGAMEDPKVISTGGNRTEGVIFGTFQGFSSDRFIQMNENAYGHYPLRWSAEGYDGLKVISLAINNVKGEVNSEKLKDELSKIKEFHGETGVILFDDNGNAQRSITLKMIKGGKFVPYEN